MDTTKKRAYKPRINLISLDVEFMAAVADTQLRTVNRVFMQSLDMNDIKWIVVLEGQSSPTRLCKSKSPSVAQAAIATNNWRISTNHLTKDGATVCFNKTLALLTELGIIEMEEDKSGGKPKAK